MKKLLGGLSTLCAVLSTGIAMAAPVQWTTASGGNGHWYDIVVTDAKDYWSTLTTGINFNDAKAKAFASGGYLATPDRPNEAAFIYNNVVAPTAGTKKQIYWLGAYSNGSIEQYKWQWVTGGPVTQWGGYAYIDWSLGPRFYDYDGLQGIILVPNNTWTSMSALQDCPAAWLLNGYVVEYNSAAEMLPPVVNAGDDQTVNEGVTVVLNGKNSSDPNGDPLTYEWTPPSGISLDLSDPVHPVFIAPAVAAAGTTLTFKLKVNDGHQDSKEDSVDITVKNVNNPPVPEPGPDQEVKEGSVVWLDGSGSYDPDKEPISYLWVQAGGPAVELSGPNSPKASFVAPLVGPEGAVLSFNLTVSDGIDSVKTAIPVKVLVTNVNQKPVANAGSEQTRDEGSVIGLDGSASSDPDGDKISFAWTQIGEPHVDLANPAGTSPTFTAPLVGPGGETLVFQLVVSDNELASDPAYVSIHLRNVNDPPRCDLARALQPVLWPPNHKMVPVAITGATDPDKDNVTIKVTGVTQDEPVNGLDDGDTGPDAIILGDGVLVRAERSGSGDGRVYRVNFTADDSQGNTCSGSVKVTAPVNRNQPDNTIDSGQVYDSSNP